MLKDMPKSGTTGWGGPLPHTHGFQSDANGDGKTNSTSDGPDHIHDIISGVLMPAGNGPHGHSIT